VRLIADQDELYTGFFGSNVGMTGYVTGGSVRLQVMNGECGSRDRIVAGKQGVVFGKRERMRESKQVEKARGE
jgi:hypothetical protein